MLPEVFNTGYRYTDENFQRAEPADGLTVTWMKNLSARLNIHLAGSILLRDGSEIYNRCCSSRPTGGRGATTKTIRGAGNAPTFAQGTACKSRTPRWATSVC